MKNSFPTLELFHSGAATYPAVDLAGKIRLQNSSGGNFKDFIHEEFSAEILYCTILTINALAMKLQTSHNCRPEARFCPLDPPFPQNIRHGSKINFTWSI